MKKPYDEFELTLSQRDIYFDQLHHSNSSIYNIGGYINLNNIDEEKIKSAHCKLVKSSDVFGVRIIHNNASITQKVCDKRDTELQLIDLSEHGSPSSSAKKWIEELFIEPIEYLDKQLCYAYLLKLTEGNYWYVAIAHHLSMDGWGFSNWAKKLSSIYNDNDLEGDNNAQWMEISEGCKKYLKSKKYESAQSFWADQCNAIPELIFNKSINKSINEYKSNQHKIFINRSKFENFSNFSKSIGSGVSQLFIAIISLYFASAYDKKTLIFGIPSHNRKNAYQKKMIGVFTNISPLIINLDFNLNFSSLVKEITKLQKQCYRHQKFPVGDIIQSTNLQSRGNRLYEISFNYLTPGYNELYFGNNKANVIFHEHNQSREPISFTVWDGDSENIELQIDYNLQYFNKNEIELMESRIINIINSIEKNTKKPLHEVDIITDSEYALLSRLSNGLENKNTTTSNFVELFEKQVNDTPEKIAALDNDKRITYYELNKQANRLAHHLLDLNKQKTPVAICIDRSVAMLSALIAVLKTGIPYLPIDPSLPASRIKYMLEDAGAKVIITDMNNKECATLVENKTVWIDQAGSWLNTQYHNPNISINESALAYFIYTSGTTGQPKGVMVKHAGLTNLLNGLQTHLSMSKDEKWLAVSPICFDLHVPELYLPLISGCQVVICQRNDSFDGRRLSTLIEQHNITVMQATPSTWRLLLASQNWRHKIKVLTAGEPLDRTLAKKLFDKSHSLWNLYGPTETTVYSSFTEITSPSDPITIGKPFANTELLILDKELKRLPIGLYGELYIGGNGLAHGYLGRPELTNEKFIEHPFSKQKGSKLYKTGDIARCLPNGLFDLLGRIDDQVKIRGYRIELNEINEQLTALKDVKSAITLIVEESGNKTKLISYIIPENTENLNEKIYIKSIKGEISDRLPPYMVPQNFILIDSIPITPNGKTDTRALLKTSAKSYQNLIEEPQNNIEREMIEKIKEILDIETVCMSDSFFFIGGNSLQATKFLVYIHQQYKINLDYKDLFSSSTIREVTNLINCEANKNKVLKQIVRKKTITI